jgi:hypothetical protein
MRIQIALLSSLVALGAMAPLAAHAEEPAAAAPAAPPEPVASPTSAEVSGAANTPAPAAAAAVEAPAAGAKPMPGWIRIDSDASNIQLWGGGTYPLTDTIGLAFDMYVVPTPASLGEIDVGPAITAGPFVLTPMLGFQVNWSTRHAQALVPQFYVTGGPSPFYAELWFQYYINSVFNDGAANQINGRLIFDYKLNDYIAIGPEIDLGFDSTGLPNSDGELKKLNSLPIGVNALVSNVGAASSLMAYLAYETMDPAATDSHLTGRLTFIHNF